MRASQIWHWIYHRGAADFETMTNIGKPLLAALQARFSLARPEIVTQQISTDGTRKWLIRLPPRADDVRPHEVEAVYIPEADRGTLCVSSQVGCTLACTFCHTGTQTLVRNLTSAEIVAQLVIARDCIGDWPGMERSKEGLVPDAERAVTDKKVTAVSLGEGPANGKESALLGVRLDSGDLAWLSIETRRLLDAAGFHDTRIVASNDLDEHLITSLKGQGAVIAIWGVGTKLATAYDQPALGAVYKLSALRDAEGRWQPRLKVSEQAANTTIPGVLQVYRFRGRGASGTAAPSGWRCMSASNRRAPTAAR